MDETNNGKLCPASPDCGTIKAVPVRKPETVGEVLDDAIQSAREQVEQLCILKAKAEALNVLDYPHDFLQKLAFPHHPF